MPTVTINLVELLLTIAAIGGGIILFLLAVLLWQAIAILSRVRMMIDSTQEAVGQVADAVAAPAQAFRSFFLQKFGSGRGSDAAGE